MTETSIAAAAVRWYAANARDLPWRRPGTSPWAVLVSEVMLQQTQVSRVEPAWREWLARWPTPAALAADAPGEAIRAWGRLGYPRRALRLHATAVAIVERHGGMVPAALTDLLALPGVGAYTARAVAAFAFRQRQPVVDTNVRRVVARLAGRPGAAAATSAADLAAVEALLPAGEDAAATASVALMELGALVCTARAPRCAVCPLAARCAWLLAGMPAGPAAAGTPAGPAATGTPAPARRRAQRYVGTDRHVRGLLLAVLRDSPGPVPGHRLDAVWPDHVQRGRALAGLLADGLVREAGIGRYALPA